MLLLAPPGFSHGLDQRDWEVALPLLQGVLARLSSLQRVHWWIPESGTSDVEAWAALARCMARELGPQAGGLLWGADLTDLLPWLEAIQPGEEWRSTSAGLERSQLAEVSVPSAGTAQRRSRCCFWRHPGSAMGWINAIGRWLFLCFKGSWPG